MKNPVLPAAKAPAASDGKSTKTQEAATVKTEAQSKQDSPPKQDVQPKEDTQEGKDKK
jgi:hypothetical protein